jgi:hypothetical protein
VLQGGGDSGGTDEESSLEKASREGQQRGRERETNRLANAWESKEVIGRRLRVLAVAGVSGNLEARTRTVTRSAKVR